LGGAAADAALAVVGETIGPPAGVPAASDVALSVGTSWGALVSAGTLGAHPNKTRAANIRKLRMIILG
jgi:hypothetical protein